MVTILCGGGAQVADAGLGAVVSDLDRHVSSCMEALRADAYPVSRSASGIELDPDGSDRRLPLATLKLTDAAARRIAGADATKRVRWFSALMGVRKHFQGDASVTEFLGHLLVGIADIDAAAAAAGLDRLVGHLIEVMADADDGVLVLAHVVAAAFELPFTDSAATATGRLIRAANDNATLRFVSCAARGAWIRRHAHLTFRPVDLHDSPCPGSLLRPPGRGDPIVKLRGDADPDLAAPEWDRSALASNGRSVRRSGALPSGKGDSLCHADRLGFWARSSGRPPKKHTGASRCPERHARRQRKFRRTMSRLRKSSAQLKRMLRGGLADTGRFRKRGLARP